VIGILERDTRSGIHVLELDYIADPGKRSPEWEADARRGLSKRDWEREYKRNWTVAAGLGVYSDTFDREMHVAKSSLSVYSDRPILRGFDFGLTPACVFAQTDPQGRINVLAEVVTWSGRGDATQMGIEQFCPVVQMRTNQDYAKMQYRDWADPAGWQKAQTDEKTCVQIMAQAGSHPAPGPVTFTARRRAVNDLLGRLIGGRAGLMIDPSCRMLIEGFGGKYGYDRIGQTGEYRDTVDKNAWSHPMNALEYIVGALFVPQAGVRRAVVKDGWGEGYV